MARVVTLLGGESTGKSTLALALVERLNRYGHPSGLVPEYLRHWCEQMGRAPRKDEQAGLAREQSRRIDEMAAREDLQFVVADTSALVIAAYSELYFEDRTLTPEAVKWQRQVDLSLVMGLDLPWVADGFFRDSPAIRSATDAVIRRSLQAENIAYQPIYGLGEDRVQRALRALSPFIGQAPGEADAVLSLSRRPWICNKCSDPDCEHRLFSDLLKHRTRQSAP